MSDAATNLVEAYMLDQRLMTDGGTADALSGTLHMLPDSTKSFASSLLATFNKYGSWTPNQRKWARKIAYQGLQADGLAPADAGTLSQTIDVGDFSAVISLFKKVQKQGTQFPTVQLQAEHGGQSYPVMLRMAGVRSKAPGSLTVTDDGPYGNNVFYGRVSPEGKWTPTPTTPTSVMTAIVTLLQAFGKDPAKVAAAYGHWTGRCCFCRTQLSDPKSIAVGYGPVCSKRWGLPWGKVSK